MTSSRSFGLGTASLTDTESGNVSMAVAAPVSRFRRSMFAVQLSGFGSPPAVSFCSIGPLLAVSHTLPDRPIVASTVSSGSRASCRSGRPVRSEYCSSTRCARSDSSAI